MMDKPIDQGGAGNQLTKEDFGESILDGMMVNLLSFGRPFLKYKVGINP